MVGHSEILTVQRCYPQIYLACHVDHVRRKSTPFELTSHESALLAHLDKNKPQTARQLADHIGVADSTLSASLQRLVRLGCINRQSSPKDRRVALLRLTDKGEAALAATSILETERVHALLKVLKAKGRAEALHGLNLLAEAARRLQRKRASRRRIKRR
jgi:DNA-binding MarR family transcriptional regulator